MTPAQAKRLIKAKLDELKLPYTKLTAKTVNFTDLARASCVFVKVYGWKPDPAWDVLVKLAVDNGFRVEAPDVW